MDDEPPEVFQRALRIRTDAIRYASRFVGIEEAEDLVQTVYYELWRDIHDGTYQPGLESRPEGIFMQRVKWQIWGVYKRLAYTARVTQTHRPPPEPPSQAWADRLRLPTRYWMDDAMVAALKTYPRTHQQAILGVLRGGMDIEEACAMAGVTVASLLRRNHKQRKSSLDPWFHVIAQAYQEGMSATALAWRYGVAVSTMSEYIRKYRIRREAS